MSAYMNMNDAQHDKRNWFDKFDLDKNGNIELGELIHERSYEQIARTRLFLNILNKFHLNNKSKNNIRAYG